MMMTPRGRVALGCLAALALMSAACSGGEGTAGPLGDPVADETADSPSWLFTQTAAGGTLTTDADGVHTLTLTGIGDHFTAFTDRPDRDVALISAGQFVRDWPSMFDDDPPNAVLVEHEPSGRADSFVLTLSEPMLDDSTLTFTAGVVDGNDQLGQLPGATATPHAEPPASFGIASIFIDDVDLPTSDCTAPPAEGVNWAGCDLSKANLAGADLENAYLFSANLTGAELFGADLNGARMFRADLTGATLWRADLGGADLSGANLTDARMTAVLLTGANLTGANLTGAAELEGATLTDVTWDNTTCPDRTVVTGTPCRH